MEWTAQFEKDLTRSCNIRIYCSCRSCLTQVCPCPCWSARRACPSSWSCVRNLADDISSLQYEPTIQEMEFYESIELDIMSSSTTRTEVPATFQC
ncbi:unnamed protein product [Prunus brigantina]